MRMWGTDPKFLCRKHLLGEHLEMHMFVGAIKKGINIVGYVDGGLVETHMINLRHDELVVEMQKRGINHKSPLERLNLPARGRLSRKDNLIELARRCPECAKLQNRNTN